MKHLRLSAILAFTALSLFSCSDEPKETPLTIGNLELSETKPSPGDSLKVSYTLKDSLAPEAFYVYTVKSYAYPVDLNLIKDGERFTDAIKIPDSADGLIFHFKNGEEYEANDEKGYTVNLYDAEGEMLPSSKVAIAHYISGRGSYYGIKTESDSTLAAYTQALENDAASSEDWLLPQIYLMSRSDAEQANTLAQKTIDSYSGKALTEKDYTTLYRLAQFKKDQPAQDSLLAVLKTEYPKNTWVLNNYVSQMRQTKSVDEQLEILDDFNENSGADGTQKDFLYRTIATTFLENGNIEAYKEYMDKASDDMSKASILNNLAWERAENGEELEVAETMSKQSLDIIDAQKSDKPDYYTAKQFEKSLASTKAMYSDTYGLILFKQGKVKEAIAAQEVAVADRATADVTERYLQFLTADEQYDKVVEKATEYIKDGNGTSATKEYLKTAYTATEQDEDFENYLSGLEKIAHDNALAELKKEMIDEEAPTFNLKNLNGEEIALADLKGKTVVLDFWATWCGPCKISFPGMQKAVTKYADNDQVEFLFIDTWESTSGEAREKGVTDFIASNAYTFNVLMDTPKEEGSREYDVVSAYEVDGIPTKFVLGPDGKIKFKAVGFDGNTDGLVEELDMMIALASGQ